jgi:hypothetical protein
MILSEVIIMLKWIVDLFSKYKAIIHVTTNAGESLKVQQKLKQAGVKFKKEIEGQSSAYTESYVGGHTPPIIKIKVTSKDEYRARESL